MCACLPEVGQWDLDQSWNFGQNFGQLTSRITVFLEPVLKVGLGSLFCAPPPPDDKAAFLNKKALTITLQPDAVRVLGFG